MVVKLRSAVGVSLIWLVTVAGVSATAWVAIDRAGRDITGAAVSSLPPATVGTSVVTTTPGSGPSTPDETVKPTAIAKPSATSVRPAKPVRSATPVRSANPERSTTPGPSASRTLSTPRSSPTPQDRTVSVTGGQVSVRCTGATILLRIAQPTNGWRVKVGDSGPESVDVSFWRGEDYEGGGAHVTAVCVSGTPSFKVETSH